MKLKKTLTAHLESDDDTVMGDPTAFDPPDLTYSLKNNAGLSLSTKMDGTLNKNNAVSNNTNSDKDKLTE